MMRCFLTCYSCGKGLDYSISEDLCKNCGELLVDPGVKLLVFALNLCGVTTERSCEGHSDFESGRCPFPWVVIDEKDLERLNSMIAEYNLTITGSGLSQWKTGFNITGKRYWLLPVESYKETLREETELLAEFIISRFQIEIKES